MYKFLALLIMICVCLNSCSVSHKVSYTMQNILSENVVDHAFDRTVSLWKIETGSDKDDEINAIIYDAMEAKRTGW